MKKQQIQTLKPRNPWVAAALRRKAGAHRRSEGGTRQRQRMALRQEVSAHDTAIE
jgi:hypothetical protein